jgi:3-hydroxybutyryl-CoA dehydratase
MTTDMTIAHFEIGQMASLSKTISAREVEAFAAVSGDRNPAHLDDEYAKRTRFGKRIVHGVLVCGVISAAIGMRLPGPGTIYLHQEIDFRRPVYIGDTVTAVIEVLQIRTDKPVLTLRTNCYNQNNQLVIEGQAVVLVEHVSKA